MQWSARLVGALMLIAQSVCWGQSDFAERLAQLDRALEQSQSALASAAESDPATARAMAALAAARSAREQALQFEQRREEVTATRQRATRELPQLKAERDRDPVRALSAWRARIAENSSLRALESLLTRETAHLEATRQRARDAQTRLAGSDGWLADAERFAELRLRQEDLQRALQSGTGSGTSALQTQAELLAVEAELGLLDASRESAEILSALAQAEAAVARAAVEAAEQRIDWLQARIDAAAQRELDGLQQRAAERLQHSQGTPLQERAARNHALAEELLALNAQLARQRRAAVEAVQQRDLTANALTSLDARLSLVGIQAGIGQQLQAERRRLAKPSQLSAQLSEVSAALAATRLRLLELQNLEQAADDREPTVEAGSEGPPSDQQLALAADLERDRDELLGALSDRLRALRLTLEETEVALRRHLRDTESLLAVLERELLWIPSHGAINGAWLGRQLAAWGDFVDGDRWLGALQRLGAHLLQRPWPATLALMVVALLLYQRRRIAVAIEQRTPPFRQVPQDRYRLTLEVLVLTLLHAAPYALALAVLGHQWQSAANPGKFSHSLGRAIELLAGLLYLLHLLGAVVRERGLAHVHFRWTRARRESIAHSIPRALAVLLPLQFIGSLSLLRGLELPIDVCARVAGIGFAGYSAWLAWQLLAPGALWSPRGKPEPHRWRAALRVLLPLMLMGLIVLLWIGYVYSASVLLRALWQSLWAVALVSLIHGLLARWFLLGERRLAWKRVHAQREHVASEGGETLGEVSDEALSIEAVNAQTSRLLRITTLALWVMALLWLWSDIVPALGRLDDIALWSVGDVDAEGHPVTVTISLKALLLGFAALVFTWVAARNLPGLLEIGLLNRIRVDAASRYAIASLSRYLIVIVGAMVGLGLLGLRWSQLQWMAAALSVGLGFGLQEIFGNFVSGLILLFERPFRVGDIITIGEFSGTVSKIRTRATTLIDFDNKEIVVPNKNFITERLINWTLSDTRTRVVLPVGVAYGSDIARVHELLRRAASEHAKVLAEPAPSSWLLTFGASSLNFELRVFVETVADRMPVTNDLNTRIAELFAEHSIEIAFPQLDLHVKSAPPTTNAGPTPSGPAPQSGSD